MTAREPIASPVGRKHTARVLVVDDSRVIRRAVTKILSPEFDLIEAEDGEAGWQRLLEDGSIRLVISDVEMPKLDGYGLVRRIRAADMPRVREVPVIVVTGAHDDATRDHATVCGATEIVTKPVDTQHLLARVRIYIKTEEPPADFGEARINIEDPTALDPLTRLCSRRYFLQRGIQDLSYARRHGTALSVIRIDLDNIRAIYREHGDQVCDEAIVWLAQVLMSFTRTEDTAARISGGEFALLVPTADHAQAVALCHRLRDSVLREPFKRDDQDIPLKICIGLATFTQDPADSIETLLAVANSRLVLARTGGEVFLDIAAAAPPPRPARVPEPPAAGSQLDIEKALALLAEGRSAEITPHLPRLLAHLLPLIEEGNRRLDLGLGFAVQSLKAKLSGRK